MDVAHLHAAIAEVCPVISTMIDDENDRSTWSFTPDVGATPAQIAAGNNVIATIPIAVKTTVPVSEFIGRFTNAEYRAATATTWRQTGGNAKNWDVVITDTTIDMNRKKVITLHDSLVTDGILTQARAD